MVQSFQVKINYETRSYVLNIILYSSHEMVSVTSKSTINFIFLLHLCQCGQIGSFHLHSFVPFLPIHD